MNFENCSKEELIDYIKQINEETNGKFGLIWDREKEPEQIVVDCDKNLPILTELKEKNIDNGGDNTNILIEGDNFHTLSVLNYTHKESIDVIYIDPPYNTGNKDFIYNDKFVSDDDGYKHSKWLNFMEKRLKLAKKLLKEDGLIIISIDDHEVAQLKMLCNKIFGENNFISCLPRKTTEHIRVTSTYELQNLNDYVLIYSLNKTSVVLNKKMVGEKKFPYEDEKGPYLLKPFQNSGENGTRTARPNLYYPIYYNETTKDFSLDNLDGYIEILPKKVKNEDGRWLWSREKFLKDKEILEYKNGTMYRKEYFAEENDNNKYESEKNWLDSFPNRLGANSLKKVGLDGEFDYSKPPELISFLINLCSNKNATVLDFFAGSGTTAQAVLELNELDGGNRKFILATNNENGICEKVTLNRVKTIITGKTKDGEEYSDGINTSLKYFKTDFVENSSNRDQLFFDLTEKCIPMLCVKEDCFEEYKITNEYMIFKNKSDSKYTCIYFDMFGNLEDKFIEEIKQIDSYKVIYKFSLGDYIDKSIFKDVKNYTIEPIPYRIVELYRRLIKLSKGDK